MSVPHENAVKHFRFMDLPLEIRNKVYEELLCPYPEHAMDKDGHNCSSSIAPLFETAILCTNRQVHGEAREAMLLGNEFVRILTRGVSILNILSHVPVHIVAHSHTCHDGPIARDCQGAVMSYFLRDECLLRDHRDAHLSTCFTLILGRDLDAFVRGVGNDLIAGPRLPRYVKHSINIHAPLKHGQDPQYSNLAAQRRMLRPFRDHLHGFLQVEIAGDVDSQLAATVISEMRHETMPNADAFIESVTKVKEEGNVYYRSGLYDKAIEAWDKASLRLMHLRFSLSWRKVHKELGTDFVAAIAEMFFLLFSNKVQALLAEMREYDPYDLESMEHTLSAVEHHTQVAMTAPGQFQSTWWPSARQEAKLCFRAAQAARLAKDFPLSQEFIDRALQLQPNDTSIQQERAEIGRMMLVTIVEVAAARQTPGYWD